MSDSKSSNAHSSNAHLHVDLPLELSNETITSSLTHGKMNADTNIHNDVDYHDREHHLHPSIDDQSDSETSIAEKLGFFDRYLSLWVALCMISGTIIGVYLPSVSKVLGEATISEVSIPVAILVWLMIFPMTLRVDFASIKYIALHPRSLFITVVCNWAVQPFLMFALALLFFNIIYDSILANDTQKQYIAGSVILGGSPCTAMVFVWSHLVHGNAAYTLIQVTINDLLVLVLYVPTLYLLLDLSNVSIPYVTIIVSVVIFVAVPFLIGSIVRQYIIHNKTDQEILQRMTKIEKVFSSFVMFGLLTTIVITFIFQGETIKKWELAAPAGFISSSNFFELGIAVALSAYGIDSGATLATTVGVLTEVPVMLSLIYIAKATKYKFIQRDRKLAAQK